MPVSVGFISLGCAKNLVDSEVMMGTLQREGFVVTEEPDLADVVVINTCSFIDKATQESIDTILGAARARERGEAPKERKIIVSGCLVQRYAKQLPALLPEVDAFLTPDQTPRIADVVRRVLGGGGKEPLSSGCLGYIPEYDAPRYRLTPAHTAYIKIAEGCNHACSYCVIPRIRGRQRSRSQESVLREARMLIESGVKEIDLIAQDTTCFGMDRWKGEVPTRTSGVDSSRGESLASLVREIDRIPGDYWIRILYTHPAHWSGELTDTLARSEHVARYVDIPLQHISDSMLSAMRRRTDGDYIRRLLRSMKAGIPGLTLRTTFISGFPGETEDDHQELLDFIEEFRFERAGVFAYSREEGTPAAALPDQVPLRTKTRRVNEVSMLLARVAAEHGRAQVGRTLRVLVDAPGVARTEWDAPDVDGAVHVPSSLPVGRFAEVRVTEAAAYELFTEQG
ncbi:MAG: 30S ribosomal protein S12 methylthiotransferase RimO [Akkermansiaceae bacterium]|nr:30S ribosomal protein S12 methylthiotransferase RimO [Akkermansiaceae bacterium]